MRKAPFPLRSGLSVRPRAVTAKSFIDQHLLSVPFLFSSAPRIGVIAVLGAARNLPSLCIASTAPIPRSAPAGSLRPPSPPGSPQPMDRTRLWPNTERTAPGPPSQSSPRRPSRPLSPLTARTAGPAQRAAARHVAPEVMLPNHAHRAALLAPQLQHFLRAEHSDGGNERRIAERSGRRSRAAARGAVQRYGVGPEPRGGEDAGGRAGALRGEGGSGAGGAERWAGAGGEQRWGKGASWERCEPRARRELRERRERAESSSVGKAGED